MSKRNIILYTGERGMCMFNWAVYKEAGLIPTSDVRSDYKLVALIPYRREAITENGEIWLWDNFNGHIVWKRMCAIKQIHRMDSKDSRFNRWLKQLK